MSEIVSEADGLKNEEPAQPQHGAKEHSSVSALAPDERDKLTLRLQQAVNGFVDEPQAAVDEARVLVDDLAGRIDKLLSERLKELHDSWEDGSGEGRTERLRLALLGYRELADRLLNL